MNGALHDLKMPSFGADMAKGTLVEWQVKKGEVIKRGDVIAVIETHKGAIDLDVFEDAIVEELLIKEGQQVSVGTPIATLRAITTSLETTSKQAMDEQSNRTVPIEKPPISNAITKTHRLEAEANFILASPAARALAAQQQLSLSRLAAEHT